MTKCPQCQAPVGLRRIVRRFGWEIVCPNCQTSLELHPWTTGVVTLGAILISQGVHDFLRQAGVSRGLRALGSTVTLVVICVVLDWWLGRLRIKSPAFISLSLSGTEKPNGQT